MITEVSFDILRQDAWDLWCWLCLLVAAAVGWDGWQATRHRGSFAVARQSIAMVVLVGTVVVLGLFREPLTGLLWTTASMMLLGTGFYLRQADRLGRRRLVALLSLRSLAILLAVPMLFEPVIRLTSSRDPERPLVLLVDRSGSMSVPDVQNGPTRLQSAWQALRPNLDRLERHFAVAAIAFGGKPLPLDEPAQVASLEPTEPATDIASAIAAAVARFPRDDTQILLLSDGIDNTTPDLLGSLRNLRRPVHTVIVGSDQAEPATLVNVAVDRIESSDDLVVNTESTVKVVVRSSSLANRVVEVKLSPLDGDGKPMGTPQSRTLVLQPLPQGQVVEMTYRPDRAGVHRLGAWIEPVPGERSTADNRQEFQALALDPRIKVLYIEGRARPEYRELVRALGRDPNVEVASLLRIQSDRFAATGTVDGSPLRGMPLTAEQFKPFDVLLLGDLDASFLNAQQQQAIEQQVSSGKGLLMIGGQNSFGPGGYEGTPVEKALPVLVGALTSGQEKSEFVPRMTEDALTHPVMEGLGDWFEQPGGGEAARSLPPLLGNVVVSGVRGGATVLLEHADRVGPDGKPQVVLAVQRYGAGRSAAFTADTTYRWYLPMRGLGQDSPYNRFWGQLVRWLAGSDVRDRQRGAGVEALLDKTIYPLGEPVRVRAFVRDERGDATRFAQVSATFSRPGAGAPRQTPLSPSESRPGMYAAELGGADAGEWTCEVVASKDGKELARQTLRFVVLPPQDEMLRLAADARRMEQIAAQTGGYCYPLAQLPQLVEALLRTGVAEQMVEQKVVPVHNLVRLALASAGRFPQWPTRYDLPVQGSLVFLLLAWEWLLRRRWAMP